MLTPTNSNVLVRIITETETPSGIVLPNGGNQEPLTKARIISVGPKVSVFKENQVVYFPRFTGHPIELDSSFYKILQSKEIVAVEE